ALLVVITVTLTVLLDQRAAAATGRAGTAVTALAFAVAIAGFLVHERRVANPVVNLALFRIPMFSMAVGSLLLLATTSSMLGFLLPFYIQAVGHLSQSSMGLIFLAAPVFTIGCGAVSGHLTDRIGPRIPASSGIVMTLGAFLVGASLRVDSPWLLPTLLMAL